MLIANPPILPAIIKSKAEAYTVVRYLQKNPYLCQATSLISKYQLSLDLYWPWLIKDNRNASVIEFFDWHEIELNKYSIENLDHPDLR